MIKKEIELKLKENIGTLGLKELEVKLSHPVEEKFGDFSTNLPLRISKALGQSSFNIANDLIDKIYKSSINDWLEKVEVAGPGFINFYFKKGILVQEVLKVIREGDNYGKSADWHGRKVMVEFTDPNPFKEFHVGHLYDNIVGESLCRILESGGAQVWRVNYQGDVGLHVAKSLWGMLSIQNETPGDKAGLSEKAAFMGKAYALGAAAYEQDPEAKKAIVEINQKVYEKDDSILPLWQKGKAWSLEYFEHIYQRLGTHQGRKPAFDRYYPESEAGAVGLKLVEEGLKKGIFVESEGAVVFPGEKYGLHTRVFINSLGLPTYEAKELGLAPTKYRDFAYDLSVIITANEIDEYFKVLLKALELLRPELAVKTKHLSHGLIRLPVGKMASRTGHIIRGEWLLDEANNFARKKIEENYKARDDKSMSIDITAEIVGVGAVKYALLRSALGQNIEFSFEKSISFEGNCGPYLQYTYARARSVLRKSEIRNPDIETNPNDQKGSNFKNLDFGIVSNFGIRDSNLSPEELSLLRTLYKFPEVVEAAAVGYAPHLICNFLYDLAQKFNQFYNNVPILPKGPSNVIASDLPAGEAGARQSKAGSPRVVAPRHDSEGRMTEETSSFRLALTAATAQVLKNGLYLLGIDAPERM